MLCLFSPSFSMNGLFKKKHYIAKNRNRFILIKILVGIFIVIVSGIGIGIGIIIYTTITWIPRFVVHFLYVKK